MLEVESKFLLTHSEEVEARLQACGGVLVEERTDEDHYLNAPDRDFAKTDEALRLRCIGSQSYLTYKGPRYDVTTKTRAELELACPPGEKSRQDFLQLFRHLGYRHVAVVKKRRKIYHLHRDPFDLHVCLDNVENVGLYVEVEIVVEPNRYEEAKAVMLRTAAEFGFHQSETRSYLELLLNRSVVPGGEKTEGRQGEPE